MEKPVRIETAALHNQSPFNRPREIVVLLWKEISR